ACVWLKGAFALHRTSRNARSSRRNLFRKIEPSMLSNGFRKCQCGRLNCVRVAVLHAPSQVQQADDRFGLPPKFSTPVEQTVEIPQIARAVGFAARFFGNLGRGEAQELRKIAPSGRYTFVASREIESIARRSGFNHGFIETNEHLG